MLRPVDETPKKSTTERLGLAPRRGGSTRYPGPGRLTPLANAYYVLIVCAGVAAAIIFLPHLHNAHGVVTFAFLATAAACAQLFSVDRPGRQSYKSSIAFVIPAAFLLNPAFLVPLAVVQYVPEWVKTRKTAKVETFNIAKAMLDASRPGRSSTCRGTSSRSATNCSSSSPQWRRARPTSSSTTH